MTDVAREKIMLELSLLKQTLIEEGVSIALKGDCIYFFDTDKYIKTSDLDGFKVSINDLVKKEFI